MSASREMIDQQENTNYAVSCAIWNLLDTQGEEGTPLLSIADWLKFVVGLSTGADTYHDESLTASSLDGEPMSSVVRRMGLGLSHTEEASLCAWGGAAQSSSDSAE